MKFDKFNLKESRKCEKRRHFNKKAKCRLGYFKCKTDPELKLIKSSYQEALQKCQDFDSINETGKATAFSVTLLH